MWMSSSSGLSGRSKASDAVNRPAAGWGSSVKRPPHGLPFGFWSAISGSSGFEGGAGVGEQERDLPHDPARDFLAERALDRRLAPDPRKGERLTEPHPERMGPWHVPRPAAERLVGSEDSHGHHRDAGPERDHGYPRLPLDEPPLQREGALGEDPNHASRLEHPERPLDPSGVRPLKVDRDGAHMAEEGRVEGRRVIDAWHHEEGDFPWDGRAQDDSVQVVVVIGGQYERAGRRQPLGALHVEIEGRPKHGPAHALEEPVEEGKWFRQRGAQHKPSFSTGRDRWQGGRSYLVRTSR